MIIQCDQCKTRFRLDDSKVTASGVRVRCSKCKNTFVVKKDPYLEFPAGERGADDFSGEERDFSVTAPRDDAAQSNSPFENESSSVVTSDTQEEDVNLPEGDASGANEEDGDWSAPEPDSDWDPESKVPSIENSFNDNFPGWGTDTEVDEETNVADRDAFAGSEEERDFSAGEGLESESDGGEPPREEAEWGIGSASNLSVTAPDEAMAVENANSEVNDEEFFSLAGDSLSSPEDQAAVGDDGPGSDSRDEVREKDLVINFGQEEKTSVPYYAAPGKHAEEEMPPLGITSRRKRSFPLFKVVGGVILLSLLVIISIFLSERGWKLESLSDLSAFSNWFKPKQEKVVNLNISSLDGAYVRNAKEAGVFLVTGVAVNRSSVQQIAKVKGYVFDGSGNAVMESNGFFGNFSAAQLEGLSAEDLRVTMAEQEKAGAEVVLQPGQQVTFNILFLNVPEGMREFGADIFSSKEASVR